MFTHALRQKLLETSLDDALRAAGLNEEMSTADDWAQSEVWDKYDQRIIGLALVQPHSNRNILYMHQSLELTVRDFWSTTDDSVSDVFFMEIVDILPFVDPLTMFTKSGLRGKVYGDVC